MDRTGAGNSALASRPTTPAKRVEHELAATAGGWLPGLVLCDPLESDVALRQFFGLKASFHPTLPQGEAPITGAAARGAGAASWRTEGRRTRARSARGGTWTAPLLRLPRCLAVAAVAAPLSGIVASASAHLHFV